MRTVPLLVALVACSTEYRIAPAQPGADTPTAAQVDAPSHAPATDVSQVAPALQLVPVDVAGDRSAAVEASEDGARQIRFERFAIGTDATTPVADYLFVVDNSSSMHTVVDRVNAGFASLAAGGVFPAKARIAVMSTLPARTGDAGRLHQTVSHTPGLGRDPGFQRLVDRDGIARFRAATTPEIAARFALDGCDPWFAPDSRNAEGASCLLAHTQIGQTTVGAEAGLVALRQLLENATEPVFRPGAAVNVIFVSDTHDPGIRAKGEAGAELMALRPDFELLRELVDANSTPASFRVHAVAPAAQCGEPWPDGPVYNDVAAASGGALLDICTADDYRPLIEAIATSGAVIQRPVFPLGRAAAHVERVTVDGVEVGYALSPDGQVLILDDDLPAHRGAVQVQYRWQPAMKAPSNGPPRSAPHR